MKTAYTIFAAALVTSAAFATTASAAEGEYYQGTGGTARAAGVDFVTTQSIGPVSPRLTTETDMIDSGDYYEGVSRHR